MLPSVGSSTRLKIYWRSIFILKPRDGCTSKDWQINIAHYLYLTNNQSINKKKNRRKEDKNELDWSEEKKLYFWRTTIKDTKKSTRLTFFFFFTKKRMWEKMAMKINSRGLMKTH